MLGRRNILYAILLIAAFSSLLAPGARAGSPCTQTELTPADLRNGLEMGYRTWQLLEQSSAKVAVVGRVGSDLSEHGLRYSHMGFVVREHPKGRWIFVHELNRCATATSDIFDEGIGNFFLDSPYAYEALILIPTPALQERLLQVLSSPLVRKLHHPEYSMIANPFADRYQNSNQWVLEILAAALVPDGQISTREQARAFIKEKGYKPDLIKISATKRLGAKLFRANVAFDDHSMEERMAQKYVAVTVRSVARFLESMGVIEKRKVVPLDGNITDAAPGFG